MIPNVRMYVANRCLASLTVVTSAVMLFCFCREQHPPSHPCPTPLTAPLSYAARRPRPPPPDSAAISIWTPRSHLCQSYETHQGAGLPPGAGAESLGRSSRRRRRRRRRRRCRCRCCCCCCCCYPCHRFFSGRSAACASSSDNAKGCDSFHENDGGSGGGGGGGGGGSSAAAAAASTTTPPIA